MWNWLSRTFCRPLRRVQSFPWLRSRLRQLNLWRLVSTDSDSKVVTESANGEFPVPKVQDINTETVGLGIFACLLSGEPGAACRIALAASMPGLASLIAQSTAGDAIVRRGLQRQLQLWHGLKVCLKVIRAVLLSVSLALCCQSGYWTRVPILGYPRKVLTKETYCCISEKNNLHYSFSAIQQYASFIRTLQLQYSIGSRWSRVVNRTQTSFFLLCFPFSRWFRWYWVCNWVCKLCILRL